MTISGLFQFSTRLIAAAAVLALLAAPALAGDSITYKKGEEHDTLSNIQIDDVKIDKVTYFAAGSASAKSVPMNDVISLNIDAATRARSFAQADELHRRSDFTGAISAYRKVLSDGDAGRLEKLLSEVRICECGMAIGGNETPLGVGYDIVIKQAQQFVDNRDYNDSYYKMDVLEWLGAAYQARRQPDKAEAAFGALTKLNEARGAFQLAKALFDNNKHDEALSRFKKAQASAATRGDSRTAEKCELYAALSSLAMGRVDDAKDVFLRLTGDGGSEQAEVLGRAYLALGRIYGRANQFEPAFMCVARAATVFKGALNNRERQDAIGLSARAAQALAERDTDWKDRAKALKGKYDRQFPRSELPQW